MTPGRDSIAPALDYYRTSPDLAQRCASEEEERGSRLRGWGGGRQEENLDVFLFYFLTFFTPGLEERELSAVTQSIRGLFVRCTSSSGMCINTPEKEESNILEFCVTES